MPTSRYRQHDEVTGPQPGRLQHQVAQEWVRLNQDGSTALLIARWARRHPVLAAMRRPADIVDAIDDAVPAEKDELLLALVTLFQSGQQLAGRIALQAMLPKLSHFAFRSGLVGRVGGSPDERFQVVLCEFWEVVTDYPVARRTVRVAANLAMETLHRLTRLSTAADVPMDPVTLSALAVEAPGPPPASLVAGSPDPDGDLDALLSWAVRSAALTPDEAELLHRVYADGAAGTQGAGGADGAGAPAGAHAVSRAYQDQANRTGVAPAALRQRVHRARRRLAAAVSEALAHPDAGTATAGSRDLRISR